MNKNTIIICSTAGLLIVACVICFIVWQKNRNITNRNTTFSDALNTINTPLDLGTNIYDVMQSSQRNDSTAGGGGGSSIGGTILGLISSFSNKGQS